MKDIESDICNPSNLNDFKNALDEHAIVAVTDRNGKITYVNDKFCDISKYSREELLGKSHRIINSGHHPKEFFKDFWETIKTGNVWKGEIKNRAKDGSYYWVNTTIFPVLDDSNEVFQYIAIRAEITDRKLLEEKQVEMIKELEAKNKELADFAYIVSHDLKAPLRGIHSVTNWMIDDYSEKLGEEGQQQLSLISNRVSRLNKLVDGILAYSRAGRCMEGSQIVDLDKIARNTIELLEVPSHITIDITTPLPTVSIEPYKAQQLFQNLLSNSIKYMDKSAGQIVINCSKDEGFWRFSVMDNGSGIEAKYFDKIFELFQTLNRRDDVESTGVGLSLIKKIIELEGGNIWLESTLDIGTTFYFTLPCKTLPDHTPFQEG